MLVRMWRNWNPYALLMGMQYGAAVENSMQVLELPYDPPVILLGTYPKELKSGS